MRWMLAAFWACAAGADPAAQGVIEQQMQAFRQGDVGAAWTFASPSIQGQFGSAGRFGQMVRQGYPMVWDNSDVRFPSTRIEGESLWQRVWVKGPGGRGFLFDYKMIQVDGQWRIDGVYPVAGSDALS